SVPARKVFQFKMARFISGHAPGVRWFIMSSIVVAQTVGSHFSLSAYLRSTDRPILAVGNDPDDAGCLGEFRGKLHEFSVGECAMTEPPRGVSVCRHAHADGTGRDFVDRDAAGRIAQCLCRALDS